jgi:uncharacterized protein YcbK (DUF882 family)
LKGRKEREIKDKNKAITKENKDLKIRVRTLETNIVDKRTENKVKMHKISNRCSHAKKINKKLKQKLHNKNVEMENKQYENLNLIKQIKAANEQINIFESEANNEHFSTKDGPRYSDDMRTCIMDLQGSDIPGNKISNVINVVSNTLFYRNPSDLPCRSTISNICDEWHVLAKQHISSTLANCQQFDIFSDGTCREGKKILDLGVHTLTGTLSLGFKSVAKENSETVAETIKETLKEFAELEQIPINKLLVQLASMMSDRSSVMKKTNAIIDDWRTLKLSEDLNETEIKKLNFFLLCCTCSFRFS